MFTPQFAILNEAGTETLITLPAVNYTNIPQTNIKHTVIEGIRGIGGIVILGSLEVFTAIIHGTVLDSDYIEVTKKIDSLESNIPIGTRLKLKLDKTLTTSYVYNVMRVKNIEYPESLRNNYQKYQIDLLANCW